MSDALSKRIDILRSISIILVLYIHIYGHFDFLGVDKYIPYWLSQVLARVAVPVFFVIAGYLMARSILSISGRVGIKAIRLMRLYLIWSGIAAFLYVLASLSGKTSSSNDLISMSIVEMLEAIFGVGRVPVNYPLWFLRDLVLLTVFSRFFIWLSSGGALSAIFILLSASLWFFYDEDGLMQLSMQGPLFYFLGFFIWMRRGQFSIDRGFLIFLWILYMCGGVLVVFLNLDAGLSKYSFLNKVVILIGCFALLCSPVEKSLLRKIDFLGRASLFVFVAHEPFLTFFMKMLAGGGSWSGLYYVVPVLFFIVLSALYFIVKRFVPSVYSIMLR